ncbi:MAG: LapA family protein [Pontibacterium sp.]
MRFLKTLLLVVVALLVAFVGILFTINNTEIVGVDLVFFQLPEVSLATTLIITFILGGVCGVVINTLSVMALKTRLRAQSRRLHNAQAELDKLRAPALNDAT